MRRSSQLMISLALVSLVSLVSCKTAEEIKREKLVETMNDQMSQGTKMAAENQTKIQELEERMSQLMGKLEEQKHKDENKIAESMKDLSERVRLLEEKNTTLEEGFKEQKDYLAQVLETLKKLTNGSVPEKTVAPVKEKKKQTKVDNFEEGMNLFKAGKFAKAEPLLISAFEEKTTKGEKRAKVLHALGGISFKNKKYDEAGVYLSRLYTEHPKSPLVPSGLLTLGKSLKDNKKEEEAKATFEQLITQFPKSSEAAKAKEILGK